MITWVLPRQAVSGLMSLTGDADGPAYRAGISVFDVITGLHAAIGILAATAALSLHLPAPQVPPPDHDDGSTG